MGACAAAQARGTSRGAAVRRLGLQMPFAFDTPSALSGRIWWVRSDDVGRCSVVTTSVVVALIRELRVLAQASTLCLTRHYRVLHQALVFTSFIRLDGMLVRPERFRSPVRVVARRPEGMQSQGMQGTSG